MTDGGFVIRSMVLMKHYHVQYKVHMKTISVADSARRCDDSVDVLADHDLELMRGME